MLETWDAIRFERVNHSGRTKPLIIECAKVNPFTARYERREFLVKALGLPEVLEQSLFCELVGNWLARELGVNTPAPALVKLSQEFVSIVNAVLKTEGLQLQAGTSVGSEYIKGGFTGFSSTILTVEEVPQATLIYGFDLLFQNPDRRLEKPNLGILGNNLIAFDFESAFSFLYPILGMKYEPWEVSQSRIGATHILAKQLSQRKIDWQPLIQALEQFDAAKLDALAELLPKKWQGYMPTVKMHLNKLQDSLSRLEFELQRSLTL